ncbi:MAG: HD domain-containing protein [Thermodesulfobacteriota bacterium]|nr:HD domain-containing protein [Thermodesulfobacteriota bacterium]
MKTVYLQLREDARKIVAGLPEPKFYKVFPDEVAAAKKMLASDPILLRVAKEITPLIEDDFGHGMLHSILVSQDAGALVQVEMNRHHGGTAPGEEIKRNMLLAQTAALLHDIKRKEKKHAEKGAVFAESFLKKEKYPFSLDEISLISAAIREHEAFKQKSNSIKDCKASLISDSLYDADKFRWGLDNFTHTVWDMVIFLKTPLNEFIKRYPGGMKKISQIKDTFRTNTGKIYGPDFISLGLATGERLFQIIEKKYI